MRFHKTETILRPNYAFYNPWCNLLMDEQGLALVIESSYEYLSEVTARTKFISHNMATVQDYLELLERKHGSMLRIFNQEMKLIYSIRKKLKSTPYGRQQLSNVVFSYLHPYVTVFSQFLKKCGQDIYESRIRAFYIAYRQHISKDDYLNLF